MVLLCSADSPKVQQGDTASSWRLCVHAALDVVLCLSPVLTLCSIHGLSKTWSRWLFFLKAPSAKPNVSTPSIGSQKRFFGVTSTFLGRSFTFYKLWRLWTFKACLPIPSGHFTALTQFWSIDFLGINKIWLTKYFCWLAKACLECFCSAS